MQRSFGQAIFKSFPIWLIKHVQNDT